MGTYTASQLNFTIGQSSKMVIFTDGRFNMGRSLQMQEIHYETNRYISANNTYGIVSDLPEGSSYLCVTSESAQSGTNNGCAAYCGRSGNSATWMGHIYSDGLTFTLSSIGTLSLVSAVQSNQHWNIGVYAFVKE